MEGGIWKMTTLALLIVCCYLMFFERKWSAQDFQLHNPNFKPNVLARLLKGISETSDPNTLCEFDKTQLIGRLFTNYSVPKIKELEEQLSFVFAGGEWKPLHCRARKSVAILIAYRNRYPNLLLLLRALHPMLRRQQLHYQIFVVEQWDKFPFNKGKVNNIGFLEVQKLGSFDCIIFHDTDFVPQDDRNMYDCATSPRHMAPVTELYNFNCRLGRWFGGVISLFPEHMKRLNGWSNKFFGWGGEDDDFRSRMDFTNLTVTRPDCRIGRYAHSPHDRAKWNEKRMDRIIENKAKQYDFRKDGLSNTHYVHVETFKDNLYTHIKVNLDMTKEEKDMTSLKEGDI